VLFIVLAVSATAPSPAGTGNYDVVLIALFGPLVVGDFGPFDMFLVT
jgi:hypothetical protein